mmetsp:Transcript_49637/g.141965  ORF Transcript_49637/g.141965 Transcript_49637/m.141965 type:complete len:366 (+) Transcript_49637:63-1160(+)|eukprot:CAMPEP_0168397714 /NCGR_PEP_ID=MMETSP0228-20121227/21207_1 /TAXON_ID=133427 /ORGANISM="Protoceratium reticulatum, Strain CCCM 535 (=CCMP 1889)" /LENGTH=365 /DNA_ID=CAMNT_0008411197 /DNA_START=61 /DNA_END=1158 /DNA_ORIENTATION=-
MEVNILEADNPPVKSVLAIHAGSVRRQQKLEVNQPFVIPHPGSLNCAVEVTVFQQLASHLLPDDGKPEATCSIPVRRPDGAASQVKLLVRRGDQAMTVPEPTKSPASQDSLALARDYRDYLDHHQLQERIQGLIQDVLREQPDDPYKYMFEQLRTSKDTKAVPPVQNVCKQAAPQAPLVPVPPPKPREQKAPRTGRTFASSDVRDEATKRDMRAAAEENRQIARVVIRNVLQTSGSLRVAKESLREGVRRDTSRQLVADVLGRAREKAITKAVSGQAAHEQARCSLGLVFRNASVRLSPEYLRAQTRWTIHCVFRGAANIIGDDEDMRKRCFASDFTLRRGSVPTPIVLLNAESSWGNWLSSSPK